MEFLTIKITSVKIFKRALLSLVVPFSIFAFSTVAYGEPEALAVPAENPVQETISEAPAAAPEIEVVTPAPEAPPAESEEASAPAPSREHQLSDELYQKGLKALNRGYLDKAEGYFNRVLILNPNDKKAQTGLAYVNQSEWKKTSSVAETRSAARGSASQKLILLYNQLKTSIDEARWVQARKTAKSILAIQPQDEVVLIKLKAIDNQLFGAILEMAHEAETKGDFEKASRHCYAALQIRHDDGVREKIDALQEKIEEQKSQISDQVYQEALIANQNGDVQEAKLLCKKALRVYPKNLHAKRMLDRLAVSSD